MQRHAKITQMVRHTHGEDSASVTYASSDDLVSLSFKEMVRRRKMVVERQAITEALRRTAGNKTKAARLLGISYTTLRSKIKLYNIRITVQVFSKPAA
jgi:DNA-binding NtrC family response regulator